MSATEIHAAVNEALEGRRLLEHPFYRRWEAGELDRVELSRYAEQYRYIEAVLLEVLEATVELLSDDVSRGLVEQNLADERTNPASHIELFETFAAAVEARSDAEALQGAQDVVAVYRKSVRTDAVSVLSTIAAYEVQARDIACSKADGLRSHYGLSDQETMFWDVHGVLENDHARWTIEALEALGADPDEVRAAAKASADAWWAFLDEREELASSVSLG